MHRSKRSLLTILALFLSSGCSEALGEFGATPGGIQDMKLARDLIAQGQVPPPEAFVVEGMFSEHDLPLAGAPCERTLCLRAAAGVAPDLDEAPRGWVQVGMSSRINPETYQRPSVTVIATVDVSGSMGWRYGDNSPGEMSRALLRRVADELGAEDRIAIVTYGSEVDTRLELVAGDQHGRVREVIDELDEAGSTNMEGGLVRAFAIARQALGSTDEVRVMLFTDAQPNVGATSPSQFEQMAGEAADDGVSLTVFAMGLGASQELTLAMSALRGGNAFGITDPSAIERVMEESWPYLLAPIAYDLELVVQPSDGVSVSRGFGFPGQGEEGASLEVASVFLSKRKGALLLELSGLGEQGFKANAALSYETRDGERVEQTLEAHHDGQGLDERGHSFEQRSVAKATALALLVSGMREAAEAYQGDAAVAVERMTTVAERIGADAAALDDEALDAEVELAQALLALMESGAPQGDLYGGY